jgi:hypothetical protein
VRAVDALQGIAERFELVVGVTGIFVGGDNQIVDISVPQGTLKDLLDAVVKADTNYKWSQADDGGILVSLGPPLSAMDVMVSSFEVESIPRARLPQRISAIPELGGWLSQHKCLVEEFVAGRPSSGVLELGLHLTNQPLSSVLGEIAKKSKKYLWSAVQYSYDPCRINLVP